MNDYYDDERARRAENQQKIFSNRVKVIVFLLAVATASLTIWEKCASLSHQSASGTDSVKRTRDSAVTGPGSAYRSPPTTSSHKRHPKSNSSPAGQGGAETGSASSNPEKDNGSSAAAAVPQMAYPVQVVEAEDIEFKLLSAKGNSHAQTITITVVLTNHAANRFIWSAVQSVSDPGGNEYVLKSFTNGASAYDIHIPLDTEAPRKCTFTFGGVLPAVKMIRLFKFLYRHKSLDDPNVVEFRDMPIFWN
jgi:hypothetical protein